MQNGEVQIFDAINLVNKPLYLRGAIHRPVFPPVLKRRGVEHLEAVYAWAHTLLAYYYPVLCELGKKVPLSSLWGKHYLVEVGLIY